ncbi:MAG: endonuclease [Pseudoflavonifractor sp.]|nr:endonuclease [Pseudoflavonifractor sp.]
MCKHSVSATVSILVSLMTGLMMQAEAPRDYYKSCEGKSGRALLTALRDVISDHHNVGYDGLWSVYGKSDLRADGKIWDMYSTVEFTYGKQQCGNYKDVGDCYNREHSFPKSWFKEASPMKSDAFHVYPTDGKVNGQRGNYPYGECEGGTRLSSKALGRLGSSTFPGYSGTVFEPDDQYKGDFARTYFYMAACYNDKIAGWSSPMLAGNNYPCYNSWAVNLLLKWHRQDPVSKKETDRNDAVYSYQNNRNPFIDHPELVEYIWGDRQTSGWTPGGEVTPMITAPADGTVIDLGTTAINVTRSQSFTVAGTGLSGTVNVSVAGAGFTVDKPTLTATEVSADGGARVTVSYRSTTAASTIGSIVVSSGDCRSTVTLRASAIDGLPVEKAADVTDDAFTVRWTNIGDGTRYKVTVYRDGEVMSGYPVEVNASDEAYRVTGLDSGTEYGYTVSSANLVSSMMTVTTAAPVPDIQFYNAAGLMLTARPGDVSDAVEVEMSIENIADDVTVSVDSPFEVSTDMSNWGASVKVAPDEERIYLRMGVCEPGTYVGNLSGASGDYETDSEEITGRCAATVSFNEDFEAEATNAVSPYKTGVTYRGTAGGWVLTDAGITSQSGDRRNGKQSVRLGKNANSAITMAEDKQYGVGDVAFHAARYGSDAEAEIAVEYSTDGGNTWTAAGNPVKVTGTELDKYTVAVNVGGTARVRLKQQSGKRVNIDDVSISDYAMTGVDGLSVDSGWTAYCRDGVLVVESAAPMMVSVYSTDGSLRYSGIVGGQVTVDLVPGLYIVVAGDDSRRVVVR